MENSNFMEFQPLLLPKLKDGVTKLGDLYNVRTSKCTGSIFGTDMVHEKLDKKHLVVIPKRKLDYKLTHIKSTEDKINSLSFGLGMAAVVLGIKIEIGSASISNSIQSSLTKEQLQLHYKEETSAIRLLREAYVESQENPTEFHDATHVVTEVVLGADILVTVELEDKRSKKIKTSTSSGLGFLIAGPMSSIVEAGMSALIGGADSEKKEILFESNLLQLQKPDTIEQVFSIIKTIPDKLKDEQEFPQLKLNEDQKVFTAGRCVGFLLVPISHFIDTTIEVESLYEQIADELLEDLNKMLARLQDFDYSAHVPEEPDDPPNCYIKKEIIYRDFRLKPMLYDNGSPLSLKVSSYDEGLENLALDLRVASETFLKKYVIKETNLSELECLLQTFNAEFGAVNDKVQEFLCQGQEQLQSVRADDVDDNVKAWFLFSKEGLDNWKAETCAYPFRLLLRASSGIAPLGVCLELYNLSKHLEDGAVAVSLADQTENNKFSLELYVGDQRQSVIFEENQMIQVLDIISVVTKNGPIVRSRFLQVVAFLNHDIVDLYDLTKIDATISTLQAEPYTEIKIYESFIPFRQEILNPINANKYLFAASVEGLGSINQSIEQLFRLKEELHLGPDSCEWIVSTFDFHGYVQAPLIFMFRAGALVAVCIDHLDVLLLINLFKDATASTRSEIDFSILSPSQSMIFNAFYPDRVRYAVQAHQVINPTFSEETLLSSNVLKYVYVKQPGSEDFKAITNAINLVNAFASKQDSIVDTIAALIIIFSEEMDRQSFEFQKFRYCLKNSQWEDVLSSFSATTVSTDESWANLLFNNLLDFAFGLSNFLLTVGIAVRTLETCIKILKARLPPLENENRKLEEEPVPPPLYNPATEVERILDHKDFPASCATLKEKLKELIHDTKDEFKNSVEKQESVLSKLVDLLQIDGVLETGSIQKNFKLLIFTAGEFLKSFNTELDNPESKWSWSSTMKPILAEFVLKVDTNFTELLCSENYTVILQILTSMQYTPWMISLHSALETMSGIHDIESIQKVLETTSQLNEKIFLWQNPKFLEALKSNIENQDFLKMLISVECQTEPALVPTYIPLDIAAKMRLLLNETRSNSVPCWKINWENLSTTTFMFQSIYVMEVIPLDFQAVFVSNLLSNSQLKDTLQQINCLYFWDEETKNFKKEWNFENFRNAVDAIMKWEAEVKGKNVYCD